MWAFAILAAVSAVFSAYSSIQQGQAQAAAAKYNADMQAQNARALEEQAQSAKTQGEAEKTAIQLKLAAMKGSARTGYAASNVALGAGSPADYAVDLADRAANDMNTIDYNTDLEAWKYRVQATDARNQSTLMEAKASNAKSAGTMGAFGSLLQGASSVAGAYYVKGAGLTDSFTKQSVSSTGQLGPSVKF